MRCHYAHVMRARLRIFSSKEGRGIFTFQTFFTGAFQMVDKKLETAEELAQRLHLKPSTIRKWSRQGKIPAVRISPKVVRFDPIAVLAALSEGGAR